MVVGVYTVYFTEKVKFYSKYCIGPSKDHIEWKMYSKSLILLYCTYMIYSGFESSNLNIDLSS